MHEMQTIVVDMHGVCQSVRQSVTQLNAAACTVCAGSFGAAVAKLPWPIVNIFLRAAGC